MDLFGTAGIRGSVRQRVTPEVALAVGRAAGLDAVERESDDLTDRRGSPTVAVARDGRVTSPALADALAAGLASAGVEVRRAGRLPTPALAYASRNRRGVMVTASHNPPADNGLKLFADGVEYDRAAERRIEERVAVEEPPDEWQAWTASERIDPLADYRATVVEYARGHGAALDGLRVVVDCGNGMAGLATPQVLRELGADVVALNANVDGHFPARASNPNPESLRDLRDFVREDADLGIGHDGDADRIEVVDADGDAVHPDTVVAILAEHFVSESGVGDPVVVTTPNTSARIDDRVGAAGGRIERVRLGALHEGVAAARDSGGSDTRVVFAAEPRKHLHPGLGGWIDGVASAAVLVRLVAGRGLEALREPVPERPARRESVPCPHDRKADVMEGLDTALHDRFPDGDLSSEYGVRIDWTDGSWVLVRPSGTEPYIRVYAEGEAVGDLVEETVDTIEAAIEGAG